VPGLPTSARSASALVEGRPDEVNTVGVIGGETMPLSVIVRCFFGADPSRPLASHRSHSSFGTLNALDRGTLSSPFGLPGRPAYSSCRIWTRARVGVKNAKQHWQARQ
jgi:hypothetical protein